MPVVLWTDALIFLVLGAVIAYVLYVRRREHLAAPWRRVARSAAGMCAAVVLAFYLGVAVLDSLHFRPRIENKDPKAPSAYSVEVRSVLDTLLADLRTRNEKTYSAPLATRSFQRETVELPDGKVAREYPRLRYGGAHLKDEAARGWDIGVRVVRGVGIALVAWAILATALLAWAARRAERGTGELARAVWRGETEVPWRAILIAAALLLVVLVPAFSLSPWYHVLGTDKVGQDVFYLALKGIRTALVIGALTTLVLLPLGVLLGITAGYFKGWVDDLIQYVYTTLNSIPGVLLIAASVLLMQVYVETHPEIFPTQAQRADLRLLFLCIILGLTEWTGLARLLRGESLKLRELEYVQAARAFGVPSWRIITRHILPNVMHIVLITSVMGFSGLVLAEAVLSYVGVGVDPSMNSFGLMINAARLEMAREPMVWWSLAAAFAFMFVLVLAANLFADAVRDAFDPRTHVGLRLGRLLRRPA
jgi:peptide/nickel transport system permease protein